jgi:pSer/pThr/pTyr-binding forkhead associated (FHA) protein
LSPQAAQELSEASKPKEEAETERQKHPSTELPAASTEEPPPSQDICPNCESGVTPGDAFCSHCGHNMSEPASKGSTTFMHIAAPQDEKKPTIRLVLIKPDGTEGTVFTLAEKTTIGRTQGMIMFPKDPYISPKHAEIRQEANQIIVRDLDTLNGIYRRITTEERITPGTYFRIGRQLLRLEISGTFTPIDVQANPEDDSQYWGSPAPQIWARLVQVLEGAKIGAIRLLSEAENLLGRQHGEVRFPDDGFVSSRHCKLVNKEGDCFLIDLNSSNGTYLRINGECTLNKNDLFQIGTQVLRVDIS